MIAVIAASSATPFGPYTGLKADPLLYYNLGGGPWWPEVEGLLLRYKVDLCLWGHVHNAEVTCAMRQGRCAQGAEHGIVHAVIGNGGQSLAPFCLPGNTSCCCEGPGSVYCATACTGLPPWSRWRFVGFGYATINIVSDASTRRRLMMSFYTDREVGRRVTFNGSSFKANSVIYSFNITKTTASVALKTDEGPS